MKLIYFYSVLFTSIFLFSSCRDTSPLEYPRLYTFNAIRVNTSYLGVLDSDNKMREINKLEGSFLTITDDSIMRRELNFFNETEGFRSFKMISKNELEITLFSDDKLTSGIIPIDNEAPKGIIIPLSNSGINLTYFSASDELIICMEALLIANDKSNGNLGHAEYFCSDPTIQLSLASIIKDGILKPADTIKLFQLNYIYKR